MKQLLDCCPGAILMALNDRAFLVVNDTNDDVSTSNKNSSRIVELIAAPTNTSALPEPPNNKKKKNKKQKKNPKQQSSEQGNGEKEQNNENGDKKQAEEDKEDNGGDITNLKEEADQEDNDNHKKNPIQAVAVKVATDHQIWCAVSRLDKSLAIYKYDTSASSISNQEGPIHSITATTIHQCPKRVACLSFATVPSNNNNSKQLSVVITGDLTGDAWAWPLELSNNNKQKSRPRLLLGHTASMLTGVRFCSIGTINDKDHHHHPVLLTADRDEKIRVSRFPQTTIIEGFLLGHSAYVSAMDTTVAFCVSCSGGDGTVRLWDYRNRKQLAVWNCTLSSSSNDGDEDQPMAEGTTESSNVAEEETKAQENTQEMEDDGGDKDATMTPPSLDKKEEETATETNNKADENDIAKADDDNSPDNNKMTPSRVAISPSGDYVAVIYDQSNQLDILHIVEESSNDDDKETEADKQQQHCQLTLAQSIKCQDQPIAVSFSKEERCSSSRSNNQLLVAMKDPSYLQVYQQQQQQPPQQTETSKEAAASFVPSTLTLPLAQLQQLAQDAKIVMPDSVLEKDKQGQVALRKSVETRGGSARSVEDMPWNNPKRIEIAKERNKRHKKRRIENNKQQPWRPKCRKNNKNNHNHKKQKQGNE